MTAPALPSALDLTHAQYSGWACCWCGKPLLDRGGTSAGIAHGSLGAHVLDVEVYACPDCAAATISRPSPILALEEASGAMPSTPRATVHTRRKT